MLARRLLTSAFRSARATPIRKRVSPLGREIEQLEDRVTPASYVEQFETGLTTGNTFAPPGATITLASGAWYGLNESSPIGTTGIFTGNNTVFGPDPTGLTTYAAMNYQNGAGLATLSTYLMSPVETFENGDTISFITRTTDGSFPDRLRLLLSTNGASTASADFSTVLLTVNDGLTGTGYPTTWTQFSATISGLAGPTSGRFAFRYDVPNGGPSGANSDYIGIDVVGYTEVGTTTVTGVSSSSANGTYGVGAVIPVQVTFSTPVTVTGTPQLTLETGATNAVVNYASGSGTNTLTFNYTVAAGQTATDLDYVSAAALALNGGTITAPGNIQLTLPAPGSAGSLGANKDLLINTAPTSGNFTEQFEATLPTGIYAPPGAVISLDSGIWYGLNESNPIGTTGIFPSTTSPFGPDPTGQATYAGMNFNNGSALSNLSTYLMSPVRTFRNGDTISFLTRTVNAPAFPDRLRLVLSTNGASTASADFSTVLLTVNEALTTAGYPNTWTQFSATISGLAGPTSGRFAFRYDVPTGGPQGANSDFIGIDVVTYTDVTATTITYPALSNTTLTTNRTLAVTIADADGVATGGTAPRIYFNKNGGAYSSTPLTLTSGTVQNGVWTATINNALLGGVAATDVINYFVVAQDTLGNVTANPSTGFSGTNVNTVTTPPTTPSAYTILAPFPATVNVGPGETFTSLTNAGGLFQAMNAGILTGNVTVNITGNLTETGAVALNQLVEEGAGNYTVLIKPSGAPRVVSGTAASALIKLNGADRVTIDGSLSGGTDRSLTITNTSGTAVVWLGSASATNGANNNVVKNTTISGASAAAVVAGIVSGSGTTLGGAAEAPNSNNTIQNNVIFGAQNAAFISGQAAGLDQNWLITGNTFGSTTAAEKLAFRGMLIGNAQNFTISNNTILGVVSTATSTAIMSGIQLASTINGGTISGNRISDIKHLNTAGGGSNGIFLAAASAASNVTVANNFIWDVASQGAAGTLVSNNGYGIMVNSGGGYNIYYNSINMNTDQGANAATGTTAAINIGAGVTAAGSIDLRNNIFSNAQTLGTRYGILSSAPATVFSNINRNNYFSTGSVGFLGVDCPTLADWQTATGGDANSVSGNPLFVSPTDLHITNPSSPAFQAGTPIAGITTDIDGNTRSATTPTMGADEPLTGTAPTLTGVLVNGTAAPTAALTNSLVRSLVLNFSAAVNIAPGAFSLTNGTSTITSNAGGAISVAGSGTNTITLTFTGASGVNFTSLADGIWTLSTNMTLVTAVSGGTPGTGTTTTNNIRRLYGDIDGNGVVNSDDFDQFGNTFGLGLGEPGYLVGFDFDNNNVINSDDFDQFGNRFGIAL